MHIITENRVLTNQKSCKALSSRSNSRIQSRAITPQPKKESISTMPSEFCNDTSRMNTEEESELDSKMRQNSSRSNIKHNNKSINNIKNINKCQLWLGEEYGDCKDSETDNKENYFKHVKKDLQNESNKDFGTTLEAENYALIIRAWNENRYLSKFHNNPHRKIEPSYMRDTISSISKCKKVIQSKPFNNS